MHPFRYLGTLSATTHVTGSTGHVRLRGRNYQQWFSAKKNEDRNNFLYTPDQLEHGKERIEEISEQAERTFVVANNHYFGGGECLLRISRKAERHFPSANRIGYPPAPSSNL